MAATPYEFDDDPTQLAVRTERVLRAVRDAAGACPSCGEACCGHTVVFSVVLGHENRPLCLDCLASSVDKPRDLLRDELTMFVHSKPCLSQGWRLAGVREANPPGGAPACPLGASAEPAPEDLSAPDPSAASGPPKAALPVSDTWDAGEQACGELLLALRLRMRALARGTALELTALDPGAVEDIPAWCRLTGHELLAAHHPVYLIAHKTDP